MTYDTFLGSHRVTPTMALPATDGGDDTAASQPSRTATRASSQRPRLASQLGVRFQDAKVSSALPGVASPAAGAEVQRAGQAPEQTPAHAASASNGVAEQPSLSLLEEYPVSMEVTAALHGSDKASASPHEPDLGEPSTRYASCLAPAVCNVEAYGSDLVSCQYTDRVIVLLASDQAMHACYHCQSMHVIGPVVGACVPLSLAEDALPVLDMLTVDVLHEPTPYGGATGKGSATAAPPSLGQEAQHQDEIRRSVVSMYHLVRDAAFGERLCYVPRASYFCAYDPPSRCKPTYKRRPSLQCTWVTAAWQPCTTSTMPATVLPHREQQQGTLQLGVTAWLVTTRQWWHLHMQRPTRWPN